jgi:hypothetical protein
MAWSRGRRQETRCLLLELSRDAGGAPVRIEAASSDAGRAPFAGGRCPLQATRLDRSAATPSRRPGSVVRVTGAACAPSAARALRALEGRLRLRPPASSLGRCGPAPSKIAGAPEGAAPATRADEAGGAEPSLAHAAHRQLVPGTRTGYPRRDCRHERQVDRDHQKRTGSRSATCTRLPSILRSTHYAIGRVHSPTGSAQESDKEAREEADRWSS